MKISESPLHGAYLVDLAPMEDERGFFARTFCAKTFGEHGLQTEWPQCNLSHNARAHTLRGMHYQAAHHGEVKLVRCTHGAVYDVIVDLIPQSPTYMRHFGVELSARNGRALYVPAGFAHGFLSLEDHSQVYYHMGAAYVPDAARGFRYNDVQFAINWPHEPAVISTRDAAYPDFREEEQ